MSRESEEANLLRSVWNSFSGVGKGEWNKFKKIHLQLRIYLRFFEYLFTLYSCWQQQCGQSIIDSSTYCHYALTICWVVVVWLIRIQKKISILYFHQQIFTKITTLIESRPTFSHCVYMVEINVRISLLKIIINLTPFSQAGQSDNIFIQSFTHTGIHYTTKCVHILKWFNFEFDNLLPILSSVLLLILLWVLLKSYKGI